MKTKRILIIILICYAVISVSCLFFGKFPKTEQANYALEPNEEYDILWAFQDERIAGAVSHPNVINWENNFYYQILELRPNGIFQRRYLVSIDSETGEESWKTRLKPDMGGFLTANHEAIIRGTIGVSNVQYFDAKTGSQLWKKYFISGHSVSDISFSENKLFIQTNDNEVYVMNNTGEVIERYIEGITSFLISDSMLLQYLNYQLNAIDFSDNDLIWTVDLKEERIQKSPILDEENIFVRTKYIPSDIYSIDKRDGEINWKVTYDVLTNLCVMNDSVYFITYDDYLISIDKTTGVEKSKVKFDRSLKTDQYDYFIAGDKEKQIIVIVFGDNDQLLGLKILNPN